MFLHNGDMARRYISRMTPCSLLTMPLCTSSLGTVPLDLRNVWLASSVSGKALGSLPGLSFVFHRDELKSSPSIPRSIDIGLYSEKGGIAFTLSSNLVEALMVSLEGTNWSLRYQEIGQASARLRKRIERFGWSVAAP